MIRTFIVENERLRLIDDFAAHRDRVAWVDLLRPTSEEMTEVETWLGLLLPTKEEMEEIEISSRLYMENGAFFMTATLPSQTDTDRPLMAPITFVLVRGRLVTIRYEEPLAFQSFPQRAEQASLGCTNGETILLGLLEAIVDRLADVLERVGRDVVEIAHSIFHPTEKNLTKRDRDFQLILRRIGRKEGLVSHISDSLLTLQRLSGYFSNVTFQNKGDKETRARVKTLTRDVASLSDHAAGLSAKINFLLDATLGMINIEQNAIIKIFTVASVMFLPPTLIASLYGMNFTNMPELEWRYGYLFALGLMVISAALPFWYFKRRGWL